MQLSPEQRKWFIVGGAGLLVGAVLMRSKIKKLPGRRGSSAASNSDDSQPTAGTLPALDSSALHPDFRPIVEEWLRRVDLEGIRVAFTSTFRTAAMQDALYAEGRQPLSEINRLRVLAGMAPMSAGGEYKITNAQGSDLDRWSLHQVGLAFDFCTLDVNGNCKSSGRNTGDPVPSDWLRAAEIGEELGMQWGGRWSSPYDPPHLQWSGRYGVVSRAPAQLVQATLEGTLFNTAVA